MRTKVLVPLLFLSLGSIAHAEVKTEVVVKKTSVVTREDARTLIKLLMNGSNSLVFEVRDPSISIRCSAEVGSEKCTVIAERAGLKAESARILSTALGGKSYNSSDGKLVISCGSAVVFPANDTTEARRDVPFCVISQQ